MFSPALNQAQRCFRLLIASERQFPQSFVCQQSLREYSKAKDRGKDRKGQKPKVVLRDEELAEVLNFRSFRDNLNKAIQHLGDVYVKQLTVTNPAAGLDSIELTFDNTTVTLSEVAQFQRKQNLLVLQFASFPEAIKPAITALQNSASHLSIQQDGTTVYLNLPKVTREQREAMAKNAKTLFHKCKDTLLQVERKCAKEIQNHKKGQSEDLIYNATEQVKFEVEQTVQKAEAMMKTKQKELLGE